MTIPPPTFRDELKEYIFSQISIVNEKGCWLKREVKDSGYYQYGKYGKMHHGMHVLSAIAFYNHQPGTGLIVCHRCNTKACFNPDHLHLGTSSDNAWDSVMNGNLYNRSLLARSLEEWARTKE